MCPELAHALLASALCSFGMQPVNFLLSASGAGDNFTGLVEFLPAALYGCWAVGSGAPSAVIGRPVVVDTLKPRRLSRWRNLWLRTPRRKLLNDLGTGLER